MPVRKNPFEGPLSTHNVNGTIKGTTVKNMKKTVSLILLVVLVQVLLSGCFLHPKTIYPGPEQPKQDLVFIKQTKYFDLRPVFILVPDEGGVKDLMIDDLGVIVLPGTYIFRGQLYRYVTRESSRIVTATVVPGHSDFPVMQPVSRMVRADKPYLETGDVELSVKPGFTYGIWCTDEGSITIEVLGPYE